MVNPQKHPHVKVDLAKKFLDYLVSAEARKLIIGFRKHGEQLFYVAD
jgi:tungstate transport system substrate-binding protein